MRFEYTGTVASGRRKANLSVARNSEELKSIVGVDIYPGSLNIVGIDEEVFLPIQIRTPKGVWCPATISGINVFVKRSDERLSVYAAVRLRDALGLVDGDRVTIEIEVPEDAEAWQYPGEGEAQLMKNWSGYHVEPTPVVIKEKHARTIYRAWDPRSKKTVAIKQFGRRKEAEREAEIMRTLTPHPRVVGYRDFFTRRGCGHIVMDWVKGRKLSTVVKNDGPMKPDLVVRLLLNLVEGLGAIHASGYVHRDINPENIFLTPKDHAKIIDLGTAVPKGKGGYYRGGSWGFRKNAYRGPERADYVADDRYDLYSAAMVGIFMLTRKPGSSRLERVKDASLRKVLERAIDKDPSRRYPDADAMAADLRKLR